MHRNGAKGGAAGLQPYRLPKRTVRLLFEGDYEGAEVVCSLSMSFEAFRSLQSDGDDDDALTLNRQFGDEVLESWNLHDDEGKPIPADGEGFVSQPVDFLNLIVLKWGEALAASPLSETRTPA